MKTVSYENPKGTAPAQGLYSHVAKLNGGTLYFIAGQLSVGSDGAIVGINDFDRQFARVFENLGDVLTGLGGDFWSIVKFATYLVHSQDIEKFMRARAALFPKLFGGPPFPPNTLLIVDRLVKEEFLIEVEATAAI
jgi:enamine deaminase RidA (YjgF/YER057c/UK114 family)